MEYTKECVSQEKERGFTLAELLVVVAIIGILTAISIPVFTSQLEKSREATDLANVRSAYAEVLTAVNSGDLDERNNVTLKQKKDGWQTPGKISIGGITEDDTNNWLGGGPVAGGSCEVYYNSQHGPILKWLDGSGSVSGGGKKLADLQDLFNNSGVLDYVLKNYNKGVNLEIDSGCPTSVMRSQVMDYMDKNKVSNNLLEKGTWAYLGSVADDGPNSGKNNRYLFWTSVDVNSTKVGAGKEVPIIISTADGRFYLSKSTTANRENKGRQYVTIADHIPLNKYKNYLSEDQKYGTLEEAFDAYKKLVQKNYKQYTDTLKDLPLDK